MLEIQSSPNKSALVAYGGLEPIIDVLMVFELSMGGNEFPQCGIYYVHTIYLHALFLSIPKSLEAGNVYIMCSSAFLFDFFPIRYIIRFNAL